MATSLPAYRSAMVCNANVTQAGSGNVTAFVQACP